MQEPVPVNNLLYAGTCTSKLFIIYRNYYFADKLLSYYIIDMLLPKYLAVIQVTTKRKPSPPGDCPYKRGRQYGQSYAPIRTCLLLIGDYMVYGKAMQ